MHLGSKTFATKDVRRKYTESTRGSFEGNGSSIHLSITSMFTEMCLGARLFVPISIRLPVYCIFYRLVMRCVIGLSFKSMPVVVLLI